MKKPRTPEPLDAASLKVAAVDLLSRREYSRRELFLKLSPKAESDDLVESLLDELSERQWQSDERYAGSFIRTKILRHIGPVRLFQELRQKGVQESVARAAIASEDVDWFEMALDAARRKASGLDLGHHKDKGKLYRFLAYRGFDSEQIQYAIEQCRQSD